MSTTRMKPLAILLALALLFTMAAPASADGTLIVGEVTITNNNRVNIRSGGSTAYPIIGSANPGDLFQTTGQASTGWYEILLDDGTTGYVSNTLVFFSPYNTPIPIGGQYSLPVYYRTTGGVTLRTVTVPVRVGQNTVTADDAQVPGYRLVSPRSIIVNVDAQGRATPAGAVFTYELSAPLPTARPVSATVPVYYRDLSNNILATEFRTLPPGAHLVRADLTKIPFNYMLTGPSDAVVIVSYTGAASPASVNFILSPITVVTPRPVTAVVTVSYRDQSGNVLFTDRVTVTPGYTTITANDARVPAGMTLVSNRNVTVFVSSTGISYPSGVIFTYANPSRAIIQIIYQDNAGRFLYAENRVLGPGTHTITADDNRVSSEYVLQGARSQQVTVFNDGTPSPSQVVFTYARPVAVNIAVEYRDMDGRILYTESRALNAGTHTISANDARVPAGYVLQDARSQQVTVYSNGSASTYRVVFRYAMPPQNATISVVYRDSSGATLFTETRTLSQGTHVITANDARVPAGYTLTSQRNVQVTVSGGFASPSQVTFWYNRPPQNATVSVVYRDQNGTTLFTETRTLSQGTHTVSANDARVPAGYTLTSQRNVQVTVNNGIASPSQVTFWYTRPVNATVNIVYRDQNGATLFTETRTLPQGTHTVTANDGRVPAGYTLTSPRNVQVTVNSSGNASPSQVVFMYSRPVSATVNIVYRDDNGATLFTETRTLPQGTHTVTANDGRVPSGYTLTSPRNVQVTVSSNGNVSPDPVIFTYTPPGPPVTVNVPVIYRDENGAILHQASVQVTSGQPVTVQAYQTYVPDGYTLISENRVTVRVNSQGEANPSQVVFTYRAPEGPAVVVNVPVIYRDTTGAILHQDSVQVSSAEPRTIQAFPTLVPQGYTLVGDNRVTVRVNSQGQATPSQVVFTFQAPGQAGTIQVVYRDQQGSVLFQGNVSINPNETKEIRAFTANVPAGYTLVSDSP
ncbi:MAG TPA: SH3 domain-containing protein, partial [Candidatus Limnocylindria bacterium]|nr:SH3 domain-containing protein [Candidatus Limnocylindria bacterium]